VKKIIPPLKGLARVGPKSQTRASELAPSKVMLIEKLASNTASK